MSFLSAPKVLYDFFVWYATFDERKFWDIDSFKSRLRAAAPGEHVKVPLCLTDAERDEVLDEIRREDARYVVKE